MKVATKCMACGAFAARKRDGSAVVWGHPRYGGDGRIVQRLLSHVPEFQGDTMRYQWFLHMLCLVSDVSVMNMLWK